MGYWQCPRCGSHEVFKGTEVVGSSGGTVTMTNEYGMSLSRSTGVETKQVQVIKCKACGEILGQERDYLYTPEELAYRKTQRKLKEWRDFISALSIVSLIGVILGTFLLVLVDWSEISAVIKSLGVISLVVFLTSLYGSWSINKKIDR